MHTCLPKCTYFIIIVFLLSALPAFGQEKQGVSVEEFYDQYMSAHKEGNKQKAEQLVRQNRDHASTAIDYLLIQGREAYQRADYETALSMLMISLSLSRQLGDRQAEGVALHNIGAAYRNTGDYQRALSYFQDALKISREIGDKQGEGTTLSNIGAIYLITDDYQRALSYFQDALKISREIGDKQGEGTTLSNIGAVYDKTGDYQKALTYFKDALRISKEIGDKQGEGSNLSNVGKFYGNIGDYKRALTYFQAALKIYREIGDKLGQIAALDNIGKTYDFTGDYQNALSHLQDALKITREIQDRLGEGRVLNGIGEIYNNTGDYKRALTYFQHALKITREIGDKSGEGRTLGNLGFSYISTGDYQKALSYSQDALRISREIGHKVGVITKLNNIGAIYRHTGDYQRALSHYEDALKIAREIGDKAGEGGALSNIGAIYISTGDYRKALSYSQDALKVRREIGDKAGEGFTLGNIGGIYSGIGDYQRSLTYHKDALKIMRGIGHKSGEGLNLHNIGLIYHNIDEYQQALTYYQDALKIAKETGDKSGEGSTLLNIGGVYSDIAKYQQALTYYQDALKISRNIGDKAGEGATMNNIGAIYRITNDYQQALGYLHDALKIRREIGDKPGEGATLGNIGYLYEQQKEWTKAIALLKESIDIMEEIRGKVGGSEAKESFVEQYVNVYPHTVKLLLQLNSPGEAFAYTERSKSRSFLDLLYEASVGVKKGIDSQLIEEENSLYGKLFSIVEALKGKLTEEQRTKLLEERKNLEHQLAALKEKIRSLNPRYAELKYPQPVTVDQVQKEILREGDVLVEYLQGGEELYVFILGKKRFFTHILKIGKQDLFDKVDKLIAPVHAASLKELNSGLAYALYQTLFQPLEEKIAEANQEKDIKTLIIVPDGVLYYLPFEMLMMKQGESPEYLVDGYTIVYATSASVLKPDFLRYQKPERYTTDLLALAPFSKEEDAGTFRVAMRSTNHLFLPGTIRTRFDSRLHLPNSASEVKTISKLYEQAICKTDTEATEAYLKNHSKGNRYLHLATHGYLDPERPMYSGLLFNNSMLQTYEIFNMDIDAELVTLSACRTGLGKLKSGEGLVGLTRAFIYAGSPSILVSLWSVADQSTAAFMKRFYRYLKKGMNKAEALQKTKRWMIRNSYHTDEYGNVVKHNHPFYWAPFILVGAVD